MLWTDENLMIKVSPDEIKTLRLTWKDYIKFRTQFLRAAKQTNKKANAEFSKVIYAENQEKCIKAKAFANV